MDSRKYREEELVDSLVVDNEGYICGYVSGFNVESTNIVVNLYGYDVKKLESPNEEELIQRLLELAPKKGIVSRQLNTEEFYDWIRTSLNLSNKEPVSMEHLVKYANFKNIVVPTKFEEVKVKVEKGATDWPCIDKIAFTDLGKCIILNAAIEAKKRGIAPTNKVCFKSTEDLSGKIVIDSEGKIVGSAEKFLVGSPPGLLMALERMNREEHIDIEALKKLVIPSKFRDEKEFFSEVKKNLKLETLNDYDLTVWAKRNNINVQNRTIEQKEIVMEVPISWDKIAKIGDVVILKEPIEVLSENATQIPASV